jgi:thiol-disulfide isomerase/thioredoxin
MSDFIVIGTLVGLVLLVLAGQWLMGRRAGLARGPAPEGLLAHCPGAILVFFHVPGCLACRQMRPAIDRLAAANPGRVCLIDLSREPALAREARVLATPTLMRLEDDRITDVRLGTVSARQLDRLASQVGLETGHDGSE